MGRRERWFARPDAGHFDATAGALERGQRALLIRQTRTGLGLSQSEFARRFRVGSLRDWKWARATAPDFDVTLGYKRAIASSACTRRRAGNFSTLPHLEKTAMMISEHSVKSLLIMMRFNETLLATGTGFIAETQKGPALITNRHNLTGRDQNTGKPLSKTGGIPNNVQIVHNSKNKLGEWVIRKELLYDGDDKARWIEHPTLKSKADIVLLPLVELTDVALFPYNIHAPGPEIFVGPADAVSVIGFPFGLTAGGAFAVWATGFCASEPEINFDGLPIQLIDCRSRPGQSGSPVIAYRSGGMVTMANGDSSVFGGPIFRLIGIYSGRINAESDIGIVWRVSAIMDIVDSM